MTSDEIVAAERHVLQWLIQGSTGSQCREDRWSLLRAYTFRSVPHQVLFDCLWEMRRKSPETIRELLPARLVRAGFPDFDLAPFFEPDDLSNIEAHRLFQNLTGDMDS